MPIVTPRDMIDTTGSISGVVTDQRTGEPLIGAMVLVTTVGSDSRSTITDSHGGYTISGLPESSYQVRFTYGDLVIVHDAVDVHHGYSTAVFQKLLLRPEIR